MYIETTSTCDSTCPEGVGNPFTNRETSRSAWEPLKNVVTIAAIFLRAMRRDRPPQQDAVYDMAAVRVWARGGYRWKTHDIGNGEL